MNINDEELDLLLDAINTKIAAMDFAAKQLDLAIIENKGIMPLLRRLEKEKEQRSWSWQRTGE